MKRPKLDGAYIRIYAGSKNNAPKATKKTNMFFVDSNTPLSQYNRTDNTFDSKAIFTQG